MSLRKNAAIFTAENTVNLKAAVSVLMLMSMWPFFFFFFRSLLIIVKLRNGVYSYLFTLLKNRHQNQLIMTELKLIHYCDNNYISDILKDFNSVSMPLNVIVQFSSLCDY